jgi:TonB-dependent SusC/RagA subfamily outer membrane receptor
LTILILLFQIRTSQLSWRESIGGALTGINPADIVRIEVLKDIGSTAFYGVRGANGVILITTRH